MIGLEKFIPSDRDTWTWQLAQLKDVPEIVQLAYDNFQHEFAPLMEIKPALFFRNVSIAIQKQSYNLGEENLLVARDRTTNELVAYSWIQRQQYLSFSPDEMAEARFAHVKMDLPVRARITLLAQMLHQWYFWASVCKIPVLISSSIRDDQDVFMKLHRQAGFTVRGSIAYIKVEEMK